MVITPDSVATKDFHALLLGSVSPRPICFASTVDEQGNPNLAPFSFFNVFGAKPPILVFSPARRVRDNTTKHTLQNIEATKEVVINMVSYNMVQQQSLASCEYPQGVNEFEKAGFTPVASDLVKPFRVKESPVNLECKVLDIIYTGQEGGAGNLIICEVVKMHINDSVLDEKGMIDPHKIDLVARMGGDYYCRASGDSVFVVPKPNLQLGIGIDKLPLGIRQSKILTGNELGVLGNSTSIPVVSDNVQDTRLKEIFNTYQDGSDELVDALHKYAQELIKRNQIDSAWQVLLSN
jgi:flavin reductase (DIM6/NTAB) family NADH-FMN oxidoreductase RutF